MIRINNFNNTILKDISFHLQEGENLLILGSNGAGKSTLAKLLCGIIYSENIELFSNKLHTLNAKQRAKLINYIPPKLEIFDEYISLKEYLEISKLYSDSSVNEVLALLDLQELQDKSCKTLSSGEQQLTMLASSILHNAFITIYDEPTANLDPQKTLKVYNILSGNYVQNRIIITHDLNLAYKLGYKILYVEDGKIVFFDTNKKFFEDENLEKFFSSSLKRVDDYFMVNL